MKINELNITNRPWLFEVCYRFTEEETFSFRDETFFNLPHIRKLIKVTNSIMRSVYSHRTLLL